MPRRGMSLVFNELSLNELAPDRTVLMSWMRELVQLIRAADDRGIRHLRLASSFLELTLLTDGYSVRRWCNDDSVSDTDLQDFLLSYCAFNPKMSEAHQIFPHLSDLEEEHRIKRRLARGFLAGYDGAEAIGLGVAFLLGDIGISFISAVFWDEYAVPLERIETNDTGDLQDVVSVRHASRTAHLDLHHPRRKYEVNPKHPKSVSARGRVAPMPLDPVRAQEALNQGVKPSGMDEVFSFYDNSYFVFRPHEERKGRFHGYMVEEFDQSIRNAVLSALRDVDAISEVEYQKRIKA